MKHTRSLVDYLTEFSFQRTIDSTSASLQGRDVLIYGASEAFSHVYKSYDFSNFNIIGIVDIKFKKKGLFLGHKKYSPNSIPKDLPFTLLIATLNTESIISFIEKDLYPKYGNFPYLSLFEDYFNRNLDILRESVNCADPKKIILGSADTSQEGWISTDSDYLDITKGFHWSRLFDESSIDNLLAEHVFEHIPLSKVEKCFENIHKYLKKGGKLRFVVPDGNHPASYYREMTKPGGWGNGASDHKVFFTLDLLKEIVDSDDFSLSPVEYFDGEGKFHQRKYGEDGGFVKRTADQYPKYSGKDRLSFLDSIPSGLRAQFIENDFAYTSLFVDIIKN